MVGNLDYTTVSSETLLQMLANAQKTYAGCGGHYKAQMNRQMVERYKLRLIEISVAIPENKQLYEVGILTVTERINKK